MSKSSTEVSTRPDAHNDDNDTGDGDIDSIQIATEPPQAVARRGGSVGFAFIFHLG